MACKKFCRKARLSEDSEWLSPALQIFLRAHCLLKNFMDFWRFHSNKCCGTNYDAVPLQGALDIVPLAVTSIICGKVLKKGSQRPKLFNDAFPCDRCRHAEDIPEHIVRKTELILTHLRKCCDIEGVMCQIKSVMYVLEKLPACAMSERLQTLSRILEEIMRKLICCGQLAEEPLSDMQISLTLTLVTNFIRDWSEKRSRAQPCLRICRFCGHVISETSRQWGTFCCVDAQEFNSIRKEWLLRQSISDAHRQGERDWMAKPRLLKAEYMDIGDDSKPHTSIETLRTMGVIRSVEDRIAKFDGDATGSSTSPDEVMKISEISVTCRREGEPIARGRTRAEMERRGRDKFDGVEGRDLTKTAADLSFTDRKMREEIKRRDIDGTGGYPITADGREKRDDVPYRSKPDEIRGLRDASEKRAASGKMRKIKKDSARSDRLERTTGPSGTESEGKRVDRKRGKKKSASAETEKSTRSKKVHRRSLDESEIDKSAGKERRKLYRDKPEGSEKEKSSAKEKRRRKLYRNEADDDTGTEKVDGTDDDERTPRRRRRKKRQEGDMEMDDETVVGSKASRRRKRKAAKADEYDSDGRGTSYTADEEGKVRKRRKRKNRLTDEGMPGTSTEDKSSPDSEKGPKKEGSVSSKKRRRRDDSPRTEGGYSKASGSRYGKGRLTATRISTAIDDRARIEYQLSDPHFVQLGWTIMPVAKTMRKIVRYQTKPAKPHLDWFKKHRLNGRMYYDGGVIFVNFLPDGSGEVFYPQGEVVAIRYQRRGSCKYDMYTVFSPGGKDCMGVERKSQIVAVFDTIGNGVVFDEDGATRLSYNQIGGIWRDNPTGVPLIWRWGTYEKESVTKIVYVEKPTVHLEKLLPAPKKVLKSTGSKSSSPRNKEKAEEKKHAVEEQEDEEDGHDIYASYVEDTYHLKTISLHLNNYISLRIFNRSNINLQFREEKQILKIELGTIVNMNKIVETYFVDSSSKDAALRSKYELLLKTDAQLDSCLYDVAMEFQKVKKIARQRKFMMDKYRPFLREWLKSGTRCRPRYINC